MLRAATACYAMLMLLLHQPNLREVSFLFRGPNRLTP
jgi:aspartyl-tRNA synthetase